MFPIVPYVVQKFLKGVFWLNIHFIISDKKLELNNLLPLSRILTGQINFFIFRKIFIPTSDNFSH